LSYTDDLIVVPRNSKILLALLFVVIAQIGACSAISTDEFYIMPIFCTAVGAPFESNPLDIPMAVYAVGLVLNLVMIVIGVVFRKATFVAAIFCSIMLVGNITQVALLKNGFLWCDGP
jgi:hypothetical protein